MKNLLVSPPKIAKLYFKNFIWELPTNEKKIYLTFDDGTTPQLNDWILYTLKTYNAKATFFCVAENITKNPETANRLLSSNHAVGNHTFNHLNGLKNSYKTYIFNFLKADKILKTKLFRPPYGKITPRQAKFILQTHKIIMWDVLSMDYSPKISPKQCFENVKKFAKKGSIVVFHDNKKAEKNIKYALPKTLDYFSAKGFSFEKID